MEKREKADLTVIARKSITAKDLVGDNKFGNIKLSLESLLITVRPEDGEVMTFQGDVRIIVKKNELLIALRDYLTSVIDE